LISVLVFLVIATVAGAMASAEPPRGVTVGTGAWLRWEYQQRGDPEAQGLYEGVVIASVVIIVGKFHAVAIPPSEDWRAIFDAVGLWLTTHSGYDGAGVDDVIYAALAAMYGEGIEPQGGSQ
jgi:hypothetical protein